MNEIYTLNEYITAVKELRNNQYYFRGENNKYPLIASSLLRKENMQLLRSEKFNFYEDLVNDYYSEIASDIGEFERKNFLAFSQHHGLSTNLIDLTTSPLIALYFACSFNIGTENTNNTGYVYLFDKDLTIDISSLINKHMMAPSHSYNIVDLFLSNDSSIVNTLLKYFSDFFWENSIEPYLRNIIELYLSVIPDIRIDKDLQYLITSQYGIYGIADNLSTELEDLLRKYESKLGIQYTSMSVLSILYLILLTEYFKGVYSCSFYGLKIEPTFPNMPYLLYKTPYKFDRIRNQDGVFLSQLFQSFATKHENIPNQIIKQKYIPDETFIIKDQAYILEELDFIGINLKSIYGDFDNIASYLNKKKF